MGLRSLLDVAAPAKLNLFLHVVGRRADGYHLLQSVFVLIDWCDRLHFELRRDGGLARHDLGAVLPADDLCLRAARALQRLSGTALGADISLDKHVPWGAGLGGGSSDAASTLLALNRLWRLHWPRQRLLTLAAAFWGPGEARLVTPQGEQRFGDLDALSQHAFGEPLPLRALPDWLRGRPWAGAAEPARPLPHGPGFEQLGWTVDLTRFDDGQLTAQRAAPSTRLRVQLDAQ